MFLVIIHELWHFIAAKKSGVHVHEFGVWIPPKLAKLWKDKQGTEYTINRIPLGWFVRLKWEDPEDEETFLAKDSFITTSLLNKIIILLWWVESYLMPSLSFAQEQGIATVSDSYKNAIVGEVMVGSLAEQLGLTEWTTINSVNGEISTPMTLKSLLEKSWWKLELLVEDIEWVTRTVSGTCPADACLLGVQIQEPSIEFGEIKMPLWKAMKAWLHEMRAESKMTMSALWKLWSSLVSFNKEKISWSVNNLSWPVMIVAVWKKLFDEKGWIGYLAFAWIISLALALFNILPIPALDWWRIVSVLIQAIGKFSPTKYYTYENYVNVVVFILLMLFWLFIMYKDIVLVTS